MMETREVVHLRIGRVGAQKRFVLRIFRILPSLNHP
jgi:hypothetical protein